MTDLCNELIIGLYENQIGGTGGIQMAILYKMIVPAKRRDYHFQISVFILTYRCRQIFVTTLEIPLFTLIRYVPGANLSREIVAACVLL